MNINLPNSSSVTSALPSPAGTSRPGTPDAPFSNLVAEFISDVDSQQKAIGEGVQNIALGDANNLQEIAVSVAKADLSFQFLMEIRDKLILSYQEVMRMQV